MKFTSIHIARAAAAGVSLLLCAGTGVAQTGKDSDGYEKYRAYVEASHQRVAARALAPVGVVRAPSFAQMLAQDHHPDYVLVRFVQARASEDALAALGVSHERYLDFVPGLRRLRVPGSGMSEQLLERLNAHPAVAYAEPDYRTHTTLIPNEPNITGGEWWLNQIRAFAAWDVATDATAIGPVSVFDTGVQANHPDLATNMWVNPDEIPGNGVDDDSNGFVDDINGIQALVTSITHGTPVSGTICGQGNNGTGYVGSAWDCQIMDVESVEGFDNTVAAVLIGFDYAISEGSRLSNHSWRVFDFSQALADGVSQAEAAGHLLICAAGNESNNIDVALQNYPARLPNNNVITIAASTQNESRISYSSYGQVSVDLAAPTEFITATDGSGYAGFSGTSQATPVVTGAVALAWSQAPQWDYLQMRQHLLDNVRPSSLWTGLTTTGGLLDMQAMMENLVVDTDGDGILDDVDPDDDNDGVLDINDDFPTDANETTDTDGDGIGNNADNDDDNDGVADAEDAFLLDDSEQFDSDGDGTGDNADPDDDNDGTPDTLDACPLDPTDTVDTDGDGVCDSSDAFPTDPGETTDTDGDGVGDNADQDADNDGLPNDVEGEQSSVVYSDDFETAQGWVTNPDGADGATTGFWSVGDPDDTFSDQTGAVIQLGTTTSGANALVTDPAGPDLGCCDIDTGVTSVRSPAFVLPANLLAAGLSLNYNFAHTLNADVTDFFRITVEGSQTGSLVVLDLPGVAGVERPGAWAAFNADLSGFAGQTVTLLIEAADGVNPSLIEAAVDDVLVIASTPGDSDGDGVDNMFDLDSDNDSLADVIEAGLIDSDGDFLVDDVNDQASVSNPPDSDGDTIADYLDLESANAANDGTAFDIAGGDAAAFDTNADGMLGGADQNGGTDADGDGIDDLIDGDPTQPGSGSGPILMSIGDVQVDESAGAVDIEVSLSRAGSEVITVVAFTQPNGDATPGSDFTGASDQLVFAPGETVQVLSASIVDDTVEEADETFGAMLLAPIGAEVVDGSAVITIVDDDTGGGALPMLFIGEAGASEVSGAVTVTVSMSEVSASDVTVLVVPRPGSAQPGSDYVSLAQPVTIPAGALQGTATIPIVDDAIAEPLERFRAVLANPVGADIADNLAVVTIFDNDS